MNDHKDSGSRSWIHNECPSGKRAYFKRTSAKGASKDGERKGLGKMHPYKCSDCNLYHIGHVTKISKKRAIEKANKTDANKSRNTKSNKNTKKNKS
jgi:hypothetical protein